MRTFDLPDLGEGLTSANIVEWHTTQNTNICKGDPLVSVETAKSVVDIPSPFTGLVATIHADVDQTIETGAPLVTINVPSIEKNNNSDVDLDSSSNSREQPATVVGKFSAEIEKPAQLNNFKTSMTQSKIVHAQPAARALAKKLRIDLDKIVGTGPNGIIMLHDIPCSHNNQTHSLQEDPNLHGARRHMALASSQSHVIVVPTTVTEKIDIHNWFKKASFLPVMLHNICKALLDNPTLNAHYEAHTIYETFSKHVALGLAIQAEKGLYVASIEQAQDLSETEIKTYLSDLKNKAASRRLTKSDIGNPTFTVSNFGSLGIGEFATPLIIKPSVAILGLGRVNKYPVELADGSITMRYHLPISLSFDHRVVFGAEAMAFIKSLIDYLAHYETEI